jgi:hypothetical protein
LCPHKEATPACENLVFAVCGKNPEKGNDLNTTRLDIYVSHTPAGTSVQNMAHWAQMVRKNRFGKFDYGKKKNLIRYGNDQPPRYPLDLIKTNIALFSGGEDVLANTADVERLAKELNPKYLVHHDVLDEYVSNCYMQNLITRL